MNPLCFEDENLDDFTYFMVYTHQSSDHRWTPVICKDFWEIDWIQTAQQNG